MKVGQKVKILKGMQDFTKARNLIGRVGTIILIRNNGGTGDEYRVEVDDNREFWLLDPEIELIMDCPRAKAI